MVLSTEAFGYARCINPASPAPEGEDSGLLGPLAGKIYPIRVSEEIIVELNQYRWSAELDTFGGVSGDLF